MAYSLLTPVTRSLLTSLLLVPALVVGAAAQASGAAGEVLTNESVIQMVTGKVPKDLIMSKIRATKSTFDITPAGLIALNLNKVPTDIVKTMLLSTVSGTREGSKETLNNEGVIKMVLGQLPKEIIITKIQTSKPDYDLTTNGIINLNQNKVSQDVVKAMMAATAGTPTTPAPGRRGGGPPSSCVASRCLGTTEVLALNCPSFRGRRQSRPAIPSSRLGIH